MHLPTLTLRLRPVNRAHEEKAGKGHLLVTCTETRHSRRIVAQVCLHLEHNNVGRLTMASKSTVKCRNILANEADSCGLRPTHKQQLRLKSKQ